MASFPYLRNSVLLPIDPSTNSPFLQHSMLSRLYGTLPWHKFELAKRAHWPDHWPNVSKSNSSWANQFALCHVNLIHNLILSSVQSNRCCLGFGIIDASSNLRPGVLLALPLSHLDLDCGAMLRCVCLYTVPHSSYEVRRCVQHTLW